MTHISRDAFGNADDLIGTPIGQRLELLHGLACYRARPSLIDCRVVVMLDKYDFGTRAGTRRRNDRGNISVR